MTVFFLKTDFRYLQLFLREGEEPVYFCYLPAPHLFSTQRKREAAIGTNPNLSCLDLEGLNIPVGQPLLHTS